MTDLAPAFLADILQHPEDDTPRLVYADWLDDAGDGARAEFIRLQVHRVARWCEFCDGTAPTCVGVVCNDLAKRERDLLEADAGTWATPVAAALGLYHWGHEGGQVGTGDEGRTWAWRRGFIHRLTLPLQSWLDHGAALVAVAPLERAEVSDRRLYPVTAPVHSTPQVYWYDEDPRPGYLHPAPFHALPSPVFDLLGGGVRDDVRGYVRYATSADATAALSHALLTLARGG